MSNEILEEKDKVKLILSKIKENSKKLLLLLFIIIFVLISFFLINKREEKKNILISQEFNKAKILIQNEKKNEGFTLLKQIVEKKHKFYSPLSLYLIIDSKLEKTNEEIIELFDKVISIKKIDKENINLIKIKKAIFISNYSDEQKILELLNPIVNSDSVWRSNAINILGNYFLSTGDSLKAEYYFKLQKEKNKN